MPQYNHISIALPLMAELDNLPSMLEQLRAQTFRNFSVYCCVNQPEAWRHPTADLPSDAAKVVVNNEQSLRLLQTVTDLNLTLLDHCSLGLGWSPKKQGVGWARKELFSRILADKKEEELIVSMDADTAFSPHYLQTVLNAMNRHPEWNALSVPYYHPLTSNDATNRALLRYEIYMRHYLLNLLLIDNPYAFTALGSALVFPAWAYRRVGGITPLQGGEDFYLLQKFCKTGNIGKQLSETVQPQGRLSLRVPFGTGPAIAKGVDSMDNIYPFHAVASFHQVAETFAAMPSLYERDFETPMSPFLRQQLRTDDLWGPLRKNFKTKALFVHACQERVDGLRLLQFLKATHTGNNIRNLTDFCRTQNILLPRNFSFTATPIDQLNALRNQLYQLELKLRG